MQWRNEQLQICLFKTMALQNQMIQVLLSKSSAILLNDPHKPLAYFCLWMVCFSNFIVWYVSFLPEKHDLKMVLHCYGVTGTFFVCTRIFPIIKCKSHIRIFVLIFRGVWHQHWPLISVILNYWNLCVH